MTCAPKSINMITFCPSTIMGPHWTIPPGKQSGLQYPLVLVAYLEDGPSVPFICTQSSRWRLVPPSQSTWKPSAHQQWLGLIGPSHQVSNQVQIQEWDSWGCFSWACLSGCPHTGHSWSRVGVECGVLLLAGVAFTGRGWAAFPQFPLAGLKLTLG